MIAPMEKVTILVFHKVKDEFLAALQGLGLLHISQQRKDSDDELKLLQSQIMRCELFLKTAKKQKDPEQFDRQASRFGQKQGFDLVELFEKLRSESSLLSDKQEKIQREIRNLAPWGDFDRTAIDRLNNAGIKIRFFISPLKKFDPEAFEEGINAHEISRDKSYVYFVVFEKDRGVKLEFDEFFYPAVDIKALEQEMDDVTGRIKENDELLMNVLSAKDSVQEFYNQASTRLNYLLVSKNLEQAAEEKVFIINGWLPKDKEAQIKEFLEKQEVYYYFSLPEQGEEVPVLLRNNWFARLFEPITRMFALPQYAEMDLTAFFAPFFTLFFGFCLGDAGYGLIILLLCGGFWFKAKKSQRPFLALGAVFGVSTFLFGLISGNLFGVELVRFEPFKKMVLFSQDQLFYLSLQIGLVQIFFGIFLKAISKIRQSGIMSSLGTWGWLIMLSGVVPCVLAYLADENSPAWAVYCSLGGLLIIMLFHDLKANIFKRVLTSFGELYGGLTGFLGDVLSYVRLFALGISGAILGLVVNEIGMQFRAIPYVGFFVAFVFLIFGHTANLLLSGLSSFVHPLRLTFVEFYKNAGFEGGGKAYVPFKNVQ